MATITDKNGEPHEGTCIAYEELFGEIEDENRVARRISKDLAGAVGKWKGVKKCCTSARAIAELRPVFEKWVADTVKANPGATLIAKGWNQGAIKCDSGTTSSGKRWCDAKFTTIVCYVDLDIPE